MRREDDSVNPTHLILEYLEMCERFGPLDFEVFIEAWKDADAIARATVIDDDHED